MEHRLIQGGEQFLPFARSCVAKLKKLGLAYADQSYEVDGASIKVRIEPGHEYIRIDDPGGGYMETGQLGWTFPGYANPTKNDPATWHLLDIPADSHYLGKVDKNGKQKNNPAISSASQAVGYKPTHSSNPDRATLDAALEEAYKDATVMKKLTAGFYPPSLFSGKMRLFMQALYGAAEGKGYNPLGVELFGTTPTLNYTDRTGESIQFGVWTSATPGICTASDGSYWLVNLSVTGGRNSVTFYPIRLSSGGKAMLVAARAGVGDLGKAEAYAFASSEIKLSEPHVALLYTLAIGDPLAYGWKFNMSGTQARVVTHRLTGTGNLDDVLNSTTTTLSLGVGRNGRGGYEFHATASSSSNGRWTDGWGYFNYFVPSDTVVGGPLVCPSIAMNRPAVAPAFNFGEVSVYGYYVGDAWVDVTMSRDVAVGPFPKFKNKWSDNMRWPGGDPAAFHATPYAYTRAWTPANEGSSYEEHTTYEGTVMTLKVGDAEYKGTSEYGQHMFYTRTANAGGSVGNSVRFYGAATIPTAYDGSSPPGAITTGTENYGMVQLATVELKTLIYTGYSNDCWTFVIPNGDCSAVYAAKLKVEATDLMERHTTTGTGVIGFSGTTLTYGTPGNPDYSPGMSYSFIPYSQCSEVGGWFGIYGSTAVHDTTPPPAHYYEVYCFNTHVTAQPGTMGGSYYALFNVDINYPYYDRGMYTYTSANGRFTMSEGVTSPSSVNYLHRFVGWA